MNILLNIPEDVVGKYQNEADKDKRSRKNLMEKVLIDYFQPRHALPPQEDNKSVNKEQYAAPKIDQFQTYKDEIKATTYSGDLQKLMKIVKSDNYIHGWQQKQLETLATDHAKTFI